MTWNPEDPPPVAGPEPGLSADPEALYRSIVEASPDGVAVTDLKGRLIMVSPVAHAMLGFGASGEMIGRNFLDFVAPTDREMARALVEAYLEGRRPGVFRFGMLRRDGHVFPCEGHAAVLRDASGAPRAVVLLFRDVSDRYEAEEMVRRSEERYRLLFDANPQPLWVYDLETLAFLAVNDAAILKYGYNRDEFLGMTIADIRPQEDVARLLLNVAEVRAGLDHAGVWRHRFKDGTVIDVEITSHTLEFEGRAAEMVVAQDVSERRRQEERIRHFTRLYALLSQVNQRIVRVREKGRLLDEICRVAVEHGGFLLAWIGLVDPESGDLRPCAQAGVDEGYLSALRINVNDPVSGRGPSGRAMRERSVVATEDFATDPHMRPWRERALARGFRSSAAVPLCRGGRAVGVLNLYSAVPHFFVEEERALLSELGEDISFALDAIDADEGRRHAELALRSSEARLEHLLRASPATIYVLSVRGQDLVPTWASDNITKVLGYSMEAVEGRDWWLDRLHPEDRERAGSVVKRLFAEGRVVHEYRFRDVEGQYRWLQDELVLIRDESGNPQEIIGAWTDITPLKRAEESRLDLERQLLHAQKLESLGVLAGGIAHDFNNLLMAVMGNLDLARSRLAPDHPAVAGLTDAAQAAGRAADLTRQILAYAGRGRFMVGPVDLNSMVVQNSHLLLASMPKTVALKLDLHPALPAVEADAGQMQQVVMNLITNASDAIGEGAGHVVLRTGSRELAGEEAAGNRTGAAISPGPYVILEVQDDGCGMDADTVRRVFDPFFTTKATGHGLGMSAILGIVRSHHGAVYVESEPGHGTTIRVLLPALGTDSRTGEARPPRPAAGPLGLPASARILVVDDEDAVRRTCVLILEHLGLEAHSARDGHEAVEMFRSRAGRFDAVLLDLSMPRMDGLATLQELRRIDPAARVILTSGYDEMESSRRLADSGPSGFLQKPYSIDSLKTMLAEVLSRREA